MVNRPPDAGVFDKIQHVLVEEDLIIRDSHGKNAELGTRDHGGFTQVPSSAVCSPSPVPGMGLGLVLECREQRQDWPVRGLGLGRVLGSLSKAKVSHEVS